METAIISREIREQIRSVDPYTNEVLATYETHSKEEIAHRIEQADQAFKRWRNSPFSQRKALLNRMASLMRERKEVLGRVATKEMGKLLRESIAEVELCAAIFEYYAQHGEAFLADMPLETTLGKAFLSYEPIGVLLSVQPWNFPFYQITRSAAPNLMAGNTVLLKHASIVPQSALFMEQLFLEAGAPEGVYQNLFVPGAEIKNLVADERIKAVTLTGSEPAGASIASAAGKQVKKSTLELGGSDPFIVLDDADLNEAAKAAVYGRMWNAGQVCVSPKRVIVQESVADRFLEKVKALFATLVAGDPTDDHTDVAPLSSERAAQEVVLQIEQAIGEGAELVLGGHRIDCPGAFVQPTLLTGIKKGMTAYQEEIFGPVFMLYTIQDDQEAIALANDTGFGLGASIFSGNEGRAVRLARHLDTGMVYINHLTGIAPELPFGGTKKSGYGREQSPAGIYEFVNTKLIRVTKPENPY